jgi:hypothetical protein
LVPVFEEAFQILSGGMLGVHEFVGTISHSTQKLVIEIEAYFVSVAHR